MSTNGTKDTKLISSDIIPKDVRINILKSEAQLHKNTKWLYEQRYAVAQSLGKSESVLDAIEKDVLSEQMEIKKYEERIAAIEAE